MEKDYFEREGSVVEKGAEYSLISSNSKTKFLVLQEQVEMHYSKGDYSPAEFSLSNNTKVLVFLRVSRDTVVDKDAENETNRILICKNECGNRFLIDALVSRDNYEMVSDLPEEKICSVIRLLNVTSEAGKREIKKRLCTDVKYESNNAEELSPFYNYDLHKYKLLYEALRHTFSPQQQSEIDAILNDTQNSRGDTKSDAFKKLCMFFSVNTADRPSIKHSKEEIIRKLKNKLYFKDEKQLSLIADIVIDIKYNNNHLPNILLVGSPGTGKTLLANAIADICGLTANQICLGEISTRDDLVGCNSVYSGSHSGSLFNGFLAQKSTSIAVILDSFEALFDNNGRGNGSISPELLNTATGDIRFFKDNFVQASLSTKNTLFIATCCDDELIPESVKNRFLKITLPDLSEQDRCRIASDYIIPQLLESRTKGESLCTFSDEVLLYISRNFCADLGVRELMTHIESIIRRVESDFDSGKVELPFSVTRDYADSVLGTYVSEDDPIVFFRRHFDEYPPNVRREIENISAKLTRNTFDGDLREKYEVKLCCLVYCIPTGDAFENIDYDKAMEMLNKTHFGMDEPKKAIMRKIYAQSNGAFGSGAAILLEGEYGTGKTSLVESVAKALNAPLVKIPLNGCGDPAVIKGHKLTYIGAKPGAMTNKCCEIKTTKCVILLDEVDKMTNHNGTNPQSALVDLLDGKAAFRDVFCESDFDFSQALIIATCNNLSDVLPVLRDRFMIVHLDSYTKEEKRIIVREYCIKKAISENNLKFQLSFADEAISEIVSRSFDAGARGITKMVEKIVREISIENRLGKKRKIIVTPEKVRDILGPEPIERGNFPDAAYPGLVKGLCVSGNTGVLFAVDTLIYPGKGDVIVTGLPEKDVSESVERCASLIKYKYGLLENKTIHVNYAEGSVSKAGSSAGVSTYISILSAAVGLTVDQSSAMTGEIDLHGNVFAVGGIREKVLAAIRNKCSRVFIPWQNRDDKGLKSIDTSGIEIVAVKHVDEIVEAVLPDFKTT